MLMRFRLLLWLALCTIYPVAAQYSEAILDDSHVHDIYVEMKPEDWEALRANYLLDTKYEAAFQWHNYRFERITVRSRGSSSRNPVKPSLRVDFDASDKNQTFDGMRRIVLDNVSQDNSLIKERLSMKLFRQMGFAAPREAHAKLFVNNQFAGVYVVVEPLEKEFLRRTLGEDGGYLYEYNAIEPYYFNDLGEDPARYIPERFEPKTHEDNPKPEALMEFIRLTNNVSDEEFLARVSQFTDLREFARYVAIEQYMAEVDGILGWNGTNNFYLYQTAAPVFFRFLPWDKDLTFFHKELGIFYNIEDNVLTRRMLENQELKRAYLEGLREVADFAGGPDGWLNRELDFAYGQIREAVRADPLLQCTSDSGVATPCPPDAGPFEEEVKRMREFVRARRDNVLFEVEIHLQPN
jgi:spore coat protein CotH